MRGGLQAPLPHNAPQHSGFHGMYTCPACLRPYSFAAQLFLSLEDLGHLSYAISIGRCSISEQGIRSLQMALTMSGGCMLAHLFGYSSCACMLAVQGAQHRLRCMASGPGSLD